MGRVYSSPSPASSAVSLASSLSNHSSVSDPDEYGSPVEHKMAWSGKALPSDSNVVQLDSDDVQAVRQAVDDFKAGHSLDDNGLQQISPSCFPLPHKLQQKLRFASKEIHEGLGFAVIRGLHLLEYEERLDKVISFLGVVSHIAKERADGTFDGMVLDHIWDASHQGEAVPPGLLTNSKRSGAMPFHCDRYAGDILTMYISEEGAPDKGEQFLTSFLTIYNEIIQTRPKVAETLAASDWAFVENDKVTSLPKVVPGPVMFFSGAMPICQLVRTPLIGTAELPRDTSLPKLSQAQVDAMDLVEAIGREHSFKLQRQQGDIQLVNNLSIMHARSAFDRSASGEPNNRHFIRMFNRDPSQAWPKPKGYRKEFDLVFGSTDEARFPVAPSDQIEWLGGGFITNPHG